MLEISLLSHWPTCQFLCYYNIVFLFVLFCCFYYDRRFDILFLCSRHSAMYFPSRSLLNALRNLQGQYYYLYFTHKETEAQKI